MSLALQIAGRPRRLRTLVLGLLMAVAWSLTNAAAAGFRASVVKLDITPETSQWLCGYGPRQSTGVHDRLYHRIVAMDDGKTQFFLISTDIAEISPGFYDQVMRELERQTGIKPLQVWWIVTHTHSAPEVGPPGLDGVFMPERYQHASNDEYSAHVKKELIEGIKQARAKLEPARLGVGWGFAMANINRRGRNVEGPAFLGLNPDGPADRRIGLLGLEKANGTLLALIANYAMHGTVLGRKTSSSVEMRLESSRIMWRRNSVLQCSISKVQPETWLRSIASTRTSKVGTSASFGYCWGTESWRRIGSLVPRHQMYGFPSTCRQLKRP